MPRSNLEQTALIIAENVASAFEGARKGKAFQAGERAMVVAGLKRELASVLPTADKATLAEACNRYIAVMAEVGLNGPRVEAINSDDGSVVMRKA
jgi:hypothetical protein